MVHGWSNWLDMPWKLVWSCSSSRCGLSSTSRCSRSSPPCRVKRLTSARSTWTQPSPGSRIRTRTWLPSLWGRVVASRPFPWSWELMHFRLYLVSITYWFGVHQFWQFWRYCIYCCLSWYSTCFTYIDIAISLCSLYLFWFSWYCCISYQSIVTSFLSSD